MHSQIDTRPTAEIMNANFCPVHIFWSFQSHPNFSSQRLWVGSMYEQAEYQGTSIAHCHRFFVTQQSANRRTGRISDEPGLLRRGYSKRYLKLLPTVPIRKATVATFNTITRLWGTNTGDWSRWMPERLYYSISGTHDKKYEREHLDEDLLCVGYGCTLISYWWDCDLGGWVFHVCWAATVGSVKCTIVYLE